MSNEQPRMSPQIRKAMLDDFEVLEEENRRLRKSNMELASTNESLIKEVGVVREELDKRTKSFQQIQAYATRLSTQLDMVTDAVSIWMDHGTAIKDVITRVKTEAMKQVAYGGATPEAPAKANYERAAPVREDFVGDNLRRLNTLSQG